MKQERDKTAEELVNRRMVRKLVSFNMMCLEVFSARTSKTEVENIRINFSNKQNKDITYPPNLNS